MTQKISQQKRPYGLLQLMAALAGGVVIWGFVLPAISESPWEKERQTFLDENQIDPSVMFYSEIEGIANHLEELRLKQPHRTLHKKTNSKRQTANDK